MSRTVTGQYEVATHTAPSIATTNTAVLSANRARKYALFINDGANIIYLNLGGTAAANTGIRVEASGGRYEMSEYNGNLYQGAVNAVAMTGATTLLVTEGT